MKRTAPILLTVGGCTAVTVLLALVYWTVPIVRLELAHRRWQAQAPANYRIDISHRQYEVDGTLAVENRFLVEVKQDQVVRAINLNTGQPLIPGVVSRTIPFPNQFAWLRQKQNGTWTALNLRLQNTWRDMLVAGQSAITRIQGNEQPLEDISTLRVRRDPRCFDFEIVHADYDPELGYPQTIRYSFNHLVNSYAGTMVVVARCREPVEVEWVINSFEAIEP
jgi:hypothetical protein